MNTLRRAVDWRTLNLEAHKHPRRPHNRAISGPLLPKDEPKDSTAPYFLGLAVIVFGYFIFRGMF